MSHRFYRWFFGRKLALWDWGIYAQITKHKSLELEFSTNSPYYFELGTSFWWKKKGRFDHHGFQADLCLGWWQFRIGFADDRHVEQFEENYN